MGDFIRGNCPFPVVAMHKTEVADRLPALIEEVTPLSSKKKSITIEIFTLYYHMTACVSVTADIFAPKRLQGKDRGNKIY